MAESQQPSSQKPRSRPEELLTSCRNKLIKHLLSYVTPAFDETNEVFFQMAEKGASSEEQNRLFEAQQILRNKKTSFTERFNNQLSKQFNQFISGTGMAGDLGAGGGSQALLSDDMTLVEEHELEEGLAISDMVSKVEVRLTQDIYALNQRFAILTGGRPVKNDVNPCGPTQIGKAIQVAAECLPLETLHKVTLFRQFDRVIQKRIQECYAELNEELAAAGILPNIKFVAPKRPHRGPIGGQEPAGPDAAPPDDGSSDERDVQQPGQTDFFGRALEASVPGPSPSLFLSALSLRNMLRKASHLKPGGGKAAPSDAVFAPQRQVQNALSDIQHRLQRAENAAAGRINPEEIKRALTEALGEDPQSGKPVALAEQHAQTIDIMDMMYDHIDREGSLQQPVQDMLHKLQVPMIRVALQEDAFFDDRDHPARQFFNTVADAGELWMEDDPENSTTLQKIQTAIDHVMAEYQGDNDVFKGLLKDLDKHIKVLSRKATLAEKRHVEAARGQEKLEQAREQATRLVQGLIEKYKPPKFVESVLSQPWSDFLALTLLRHGDESEQWQNALTVAKALIYSVRDNLDEKVKAKLRKRVPWLRKQLANGLGHVGYFEQDIAALLANLEACHRWSLAPPEAPEPEPDSTTPESGAEQAAPEPVKPEEPEHLHQPLAQSDVRPVAVAPKTKPRPKKPELDEKEKAMLAKVRLMPFGSWFELRTDPTALWVKRKLSWYSPLTGRCLFVNNRGAMADEMSLYDLAKAMAAGNARVFRPNSKPLMDRALDAIFGRLKKLTGSGESATT